MDQVWNRRVGNCCIRQGYIVEIDEIPNMGDAVVADGGPEGSFTVPDGAYLVLGDDRARSSDSRSWQKPFVAHAAIEGRWITTLWPRPSAAACRPASAGHRRP